ncbi:hypothetical protein [Nocardia sp. NPDC050793]|uniref:hypothetical protein n=1 Tax=Nocardia sp. NPDC050793 TaxID=3155159 RepID=UPI00340FE4E5
MATVGVSTDRRTVRGVLLSHPTADKPSSDPLDEVEQEIGAATAAERIPEVLEALADRTLSLIENIALTYRTVDERRAIVTHLATGRWRTSSLVSVRAALLAFVRDVPSLDRFETILVLEVADRDLTFVLTDAGRSRILGSGTWRAGADPAAEAHDRVRPTLLAQGLTVDGVALCGGPVTLELLGDCERAFGVPSVIVDDPQAATALGAARIAAAQLPEESGHEYEPSGATAIAGERRRAGVLLPVGAAAAAVLAASGIAVAHVTDEGVWARQSDKKTSQAQAPATPDPGEPTAPPIVIESTDPAPSTGVPQNPARPTPVPAARPIDPGDPADPYDPNDPRPESRTTTVEPTQYDGPATPDAEPATPGTEPAATPEVPTTTVVGAPNGDGLFPGEAPPPPAGSDPAAIASWWENHLRLQQLWRQGG